MLITASGRGDKMFLKKEILKAISFRNPVKLPVWYWFLVVLRFVLTALPQPGYIHPDEFFQNVEVIAGDIFMVDVARTWEFDPKFPIRNIFVPKIILGPPLHLIGFLNPYSRTYLDVDLKTPYYLLVIPRLFICLLSLINDYCLYKICVMYGQNFRNRLTLFASSYVVLVYSCRSFSNSFEMIFFSMLLYFVAECMLKSDKVIYHEEFLKEKYMKASSPVDRVKLFKLQTHLPDHSLNRVAEISTIVVVGIFNRPTFIGFAFPPIFLWLQRGMGSNVIGFKDFHFRIFLFILCGVPSALFLIIVDSGYYGYLTMADVESLKITWTNWVVTPLNFLRYNSNMKNLREHGLHPRWLHVAVNVPLLFNVLGLIAYLSFSINSYRFIMGYYSKLPKIQSITGLMWFSLIIPVATLSLFPHQEARFITPVLVPLVYLFGNRLYQNECDGPKVVLTKKLIKHVWYFLNIVLTVFFGFIHQGGIYPFANSLHREIKSIYGVHTHVITTHSYSIPSYLLQLESTTKLWKDKNTGRKYRVAPSTFIHKYGSRSMDQVFDKVDETLTNAEMLLHKYKKKYRFYLVSPCSKDEEIRGHASKYPYIRVLKHHDYFPHYSSEALPEFPSRHDPNCHYLMNMDTVGLELTWYQRLTCFIKRFCLRVYQIQSAE